MLDASLFLFVLFVVFLLVAIILGDPYVFAMTSFFSIILGIQLAVSFNTALDGWAFTIVGFALILFGFYLLIPAYELAMEEKKQGQRGKQ